MNKQVYYWSTIIVMAVVVVIGWLTVSNNGSMSGHNNQIINESQQNVDIQSTSENNSMLAENSSLTHYLEEQKLAMDTMMTEMKNIPHVGDAAIDFLYGMMPHHESAIAMSKSYLKYGGNSATLKQMAEDIIRVQGAEIEHMRSMIQTLEAKMQKDETKETAYLNAYNKMLEEHQASHSMSALNSVEEAFAEGMIMHHEMAVQMAEAILQYTENEEIRNMAQDIIDMQTKEIAQMTEIRNSMQ